jgi:subtilisin family serine protease
LVIRRGSLAVAFALSFLSWACQSADSPTAVSDLRARAASRSAASQSEVIPGQYIVTFKDDVIDPPGLAKQLVTQHGGELGFTYTDAIRGFSAKLSAQAAEALAHNPNVASVEQDQTTTVSAITQSPVDWGLDRIDQRTNSLDLQYTSASAGAGVHAYIIDSGIRTTNVDFEGRASGAYSVINDGWGTNDCMGHGTHVAGIVGSAHYGVAKQVKLYAVRVFDCAGVSTYSGIAAAVDWITKNRVNPAVVNMSLSGSPSSTLNTAIKNSIASGVVYAVAAGNLTSDACNYTPGNVAEALTVGAISTSDDQASFSNYGTCVDIFAPGMAILSTYNTSDSAAVRYSGTSMAAPFVAGAAAVYLSAHPGATPSQVAAGLLSNATTGALVGLTGGSPNRLLFIGDTTTVTVTPMPAPAPAPTPPPTTDQAPVAAFSASCPRGNCTFDGSASTDDHGVASYSWSFGDGTPVASGSSLKKTSHAYTTAGSYSVTLTVTDAAGQSGKLTQTITLKNVR